MSTTAKDKKLNYIGEMWNRQEFDTNKSWEYFLIYKNLGKYRTIADVAKIAGVTSNTLNGWANPHEWLKRCKASDHGDDLVRAEAAKEAQKDLAQTNAKELMAMRYEAGKLKLQRGMIYLRHQELQEYSKYTEKIRDGDDGHITGTREVSAEIADKLITNGLQDMAAAVGMSDEDLRRNKSLDADDIQELTLEQIEKEIQALDEVAKGKK